MLQQIQSLPGRSKRSLILFNMRRKSAKSELVQSQRSLPLKIRRHLCKLPTLFIENGLGGCKCIGSFDELGDIEDDGFEVVSRLFELAVPLKHAGLVVEDGGDQSPFDSFSASRSILQNLLSLVQIYPRLLVLLLLYQPGRHFVESIQFTIELL